MGWLFTNIQDKKEFVNRIVARTDSTEYKLVHHTVRNNTVWAVWERLQDGFKFIECTLLSKSRNSGWGYKSMDEACQPYYYDCPLKYLKMVPVASPEWREKVIREAARKSMKVSIGQKLILKGSTIPWVKVSRIDGRKVYGVGENGIEYRVPPRFWNTIENIQSIA